MRSLTGMTRAGFAAGKPARPNCTAGYRAAGGPDGPGIGQVVGDEGIFLRFGRQIKESLGDQGPVPKHLGDRGRFQIRAFAVPLAGSHRSYFAKFPAKCRPKHFAVIFQQHLDGIQCFLGQHFENFIQKLGIFQRIDQDWQSSGGIGLDRAPIPRHWLPYAETPGRCPAGRESDQACVIILIIPDTGRFNPTVLLSHTYCNQFI